MTFRESAKKLLNNNAKFNFDVERNGKGIGKMQGIPVNNQDYLHVISCTADIENGDSLINRLNERFTVTKIEIVDKNILRIHFKNWAKF